MAKGKKFASEPIGDVGSIGGERWPSNAGSVISGFRREVDENCALLGYYAASSGKSLTDVWGQPVGPTFKGQRKVLTFEVGTNTLSRNDGKKFTNTHRVKTKQSAVIF